MKNKSFFWTSYSDLMTSLFFVMLLLFVTTVVMMHLGHVATEKELAKIKQLEHSVQAIDPRFFAYNPEFKKHVLKMTCSFLSIVPTWTLLIGMPRMSYSKRVEAFKSL